MQSAPTTESGFIPRKEFIRDQRTTNNFCLLTISGSSLVRLYSFPLTLIADLRRLFDKYYLTASCREDTTQNFCEFTLNGKPWASPKSERTERILLDILSTIYRHGYTFLSTIDYGREHDDRIAITFSIPNNLSLPIPHSPIPGGSGSNLSHQTALRNEKQPPFAISFVSATVLRVMYPPLQSTPAILQAVRGSWPRGVISEKKLSDSSFEFKLKGYKWFHEDTFASDSLRHILSLLTSLDAHACKLVTSLSLSNRSRVKDLWIFTAPNSQDGGDNYIDSSLSHSGSNADIRRSYRVSNPEPSYNPDFSIPPNTLHRRVATAPVHQIPQPYPYGQTYPYNGRIAPDNRLPPIVTNPSFSNSQGIPPTMLRKPAPRAQVPVSVDFDAQEDEDHGQFRTSLASAVPSSVENMTGIGTLARSKLTSTLIYTAPSRYQGEPLDGDAYQSDIAEEVQSLSPSHRGSAARPVSTRSKTPPLLTSHTPRDSRAPLPPVVAGSRASYALDLPSDTEHPLLSPGMFGVRDSVFSSNSVGTEGTCEVPIKWTGMIENIEEVSEEQTDIQEHHTLPNPVLPGGWAMTPEDERREPRSISPRLNAEKARENSEPHDRHMYLEQTRSPQRSLHEIEARVASPELVTDQDTMRKSEAGLIGVMSPPKPFASPPSPPATRPSSRDTANNPTKPRTMSPNSSTQATKTTRNGSGNGWVLVNVEGKHTAEDQHGVPSSSLIATPTSPTHRDRGLRSNTGESSSMSHAAKAIAIIDAKEARMAKDKGKPSGLRRLLSLSRPSKGPEEKKHGVHDSRPRSSESHLNSQDKEKPRGRIRNKLLRSGVAETPPKSERQRINLD
ncbi:hypothetical protein BJ138DRAFT_1141965 [Hygrophoropsis aurantiaca]|uniref:Uncharacterized protein n=1 Tax=Hygrophoropsis aurantiaca TaxID=72124 RepID=A0ACB8AQ53_9AGAM|nr:hypothetical protein BJ138DRAFT_1141965 [Hygrophoropsis aurantiaca]